MRVDNENRFYKYPSKFKGPEDYQGIIYDQGLVTWIKFNRPKYRNALSHPVWAEIEDAVDRACEDKECNVILISGVGDHFSSGDDVMGMSPEGGPMLSDRRPVEQLIKDYGSENEVWHQFNIEHDYFITWYPSNKLRTTPKPTIAMVHGWCIYGAAILADNCDIVFASENALIMGGTPDWMTMGRHKAMETIIEHRFLTAREAQELGLVNRVFPDYETLEKETLAFAYRVAFEAPPTVKRMKLRLLQQMDIVGCTAMNEVIRTPYYEIWRERAADGGRLRYEGAGQARGPVALANLKAKLLSEGKDVPVHVQAAIDRAAQRDDRAKWQKALHQDFRDPKRTARVDAQAKAYDEWRKAFDERLAEEKKRRGI